MHADAVRLRAVADEAETIADGVDLSDLAAAVRAILSPLVDPDAVHAMAAERTDPGVLFQQRGGHIDPGVPPR
jgi:hypothetical protein